MAVYTWPAMIVIYPGYGAEPVAAVLQHVDSAGLGEVLILPFSTQSDVPYSASLDTSIHHWRYMPVGTVS